MVERETLSAKQQRDYLALLSSRGGKAYVPLQLLISRVACPAEQQERLVPPLPGASFLNGGKLQEDGSIRNECVRTPTVALLQTSRERDSLQTSAEIFTSYVTNVYVTLQVLCHST